MKAEDRILYYMDTQGVRRGDAIAFLVKQGCDKTHISKLSDDALAVEYDIVHRRERERSPLMKELAQIKHEGSTVVPGDELIHLWASEIVDYFLMKGVKFK